MASAFVCDNLAHFWGSDLQWKYQDVDWMLLLCDGGGSNNARHHIVKQDFYQLAQVLDINIVVAHYPPYCSKWNPIEHRLFSHLHRAWEGSVFHDIQTVKQLAEMTHTNTGLGLKVNINPQQYRTKRTVNGHFKDNLKEYVHFDDELPQRNYTLCPEKRKLILTVTKLQKYLPKFLRKDRISDYCFFQIGLRAFRFFIKQHLRIFPEYINNYQHFICVRQ